MSAGNFMKNLLNIDRMERDLREKKKKEEEAKTENQKHNTKSDLLDAACNAETKKNRINK